MQKGSFLFLGDYVDRGPCSCEVMLLLLALKVEAPNCVHLLRGNHESSNQTRVYGFKTECSRKYGEAVYDQFMHCFQSLPLAAVVSGPKHGNTDTRGMSGNDRTADSCQDNPTRYFCVHGGLSPKLMTLGDIEALERREEPSRDSALADLLWSDPSDDPGVLDANVKRRAQAIEGSDDEESQFDENGFDVNPLRGLSYTFGASAAKDFLLENHLDHLLRAHSVQDKGFFQHFANSPYQLHPKNVQTTPNLASAPRQSHSDMESCSQLTQESNFMGVPSQGTSELEGNQEYDPNPNTCSSSRVSLAMVSTVFSAPKYGGRRKNRGAVLAIGGGDRGTSPVAYTFDGTPEIGRRPQDGLLIALRAIELACPYLPADFGSWVAVVLDRVRRKRVLEARRDAGRILFSFEECLAIKRLFVAMADPSGASTGLSDQATITQQSLAEFDRVSFRGRSCNRVNDVLGVIAPRRNPRYGVKSHEFLFAAAAFKAAALGTAAIPQSPIEADQ